MYKILTILIFSGLLFNGCAGLHRDEEGKSSTDLIPPVLLNKIPLTYPEEARLGGLEGIVSLYIYVDADGDVKKIRIRSSSNHPQLDEAAEKYVSQFKFKPASKEGENVGIWLSYKIDYSLRYTDLTFNIDNWLDRVSGLLKRPAGQGSQLSEQEEEQILESYDRYCAYINMNPEKNLNRRIDRILSKPSREKWQRFYELCPLTFILYDDLLKRFPDMKQADKARSKMMIAMEQDIENAAEMKEKKYGGPQLFGVFVQTLYDYLISEYAGNHPQKLDLILKNYQQK